jgi:hypothetical protein
MNIGDQVRLIGIPPNLPVADADLPTKAVFEKCLGNVFTVVSFNAIGLAELPIEAVTGSIGETIWVEPAFWK